MFPCYFSQGSLQNELNTYFANFYPDVISSQHIDKSAYSHARKKYKYEVYQKLNDVFVDGYYSIPDIIQSFYGFNVFGVDGSLIALPNDEKIIEEFGVWKARNADSAPRGRVSTFFDCLNEISLESYLVPKSRGERDLAALHIMFRRFNENDIVVYDRGYASICLQKRHLDMGLHFCMRMPTTWGIIKNFISDETSNDRIVTVYPSNSSQKNCIEQNLSPEPYKIRLIKIKLESGITEVLATSLFSANYDIIFFKKLYQLRWNTEENYKSVKNKVKIEKFMGKTVKAVYQEFYARMFMLNVSSAIKNMAQIEIKQKKIKTKKKKYEYKINFKATLSKIRKYGAKLFYGGIEILKKIIIIVMEDNDNPIRPGRKYSRNKKNVTAYHQTYSDI